MNALVSRLLDRLRTHRMIRNVRIVTYDETPTGKFEIKIRCRLVPRHQLQVWLHAGPSLLDYSYQLFSDCPIWRWDNAPHYPHISSAPNHFHDEQGKILESDLTGNPDIGLPIVLSAIEKWFTDQRGTSGF
jgi:hypothetical protein